jgi:hypothetical protein
MEHAFSIGQVVRARGRVWDRPRVAVYMVIRLLPRAGAVDSGAYYQVRSIPNGVEWIVAEDRIELV